MFEPFLKRPIVFTVNASPFERLDIETSVRTLMMVAYVIDPMSPDSFLSGLAEFYGHPLHVRVWGI